MELSHLVDIVEMLTFDALDLVNLHVVIHVLIEAVDDPGGYHADEAGDGHPPDVPDHGKAEHHAEGGDDDAGTAETDDRKRL